MEYLKRFDLFTKVPRDLTRGSRTGAVLSLAALVVVIVVLVMELVAFLSLESKYSVILDTNSESALTLAISMLFPRVPCAVLNVGVEDYFGNKVEHVERENAMRSKWSKSVVRNGQVLGSWEGNAAGDAFFDVDPLTVKYLSKYRLMAGRNAAPNKVVYAQEIANETAWADVLNRHEFVLVEFFSPTCVWCRRFANTYEALAMFFETSRLDVGVFKVNCNDQPVLCKTQQPQLVGVPHMRLFRHGKTLSVYNGRRDMEHVIEFVHRETNISERADARKIDDDSDGCAISGFYYIPRFPCTLRIYADSLSHVMDVSTVNMTHVLTRALVFDGLVDAEEGIRHRITEGEEGIVSVASSTMITHEHHLKLIPFVTRWHGFLSGFVDRHSIQRTISTQRYDSDPGLPEVRVSIDFTANAVLETRNSVRHWYEFMTNMIAIVGGVFVVFRAFDTVLLSFMQRVVYKHDKKGAKINLKGVMAS
ncbi:Protein disulfide-isomerase 5-4 [Porphyridium purpureum]|uniref:Protein disulfide-isomerase 5-4 n=1 Tax=Porphyridium purpureum TaxID=35688 RepID=A0A5J4YV31_PORPP|nr:Protein disulfide-isomerase 5-4 [Porphyridium purpureum]|eukprot:POR1092..scf227_4